MAEVEVLTQEEWQAVHEQASHEAAMRIPAQYPPDTMAGVVFSRFQKYEGCICYNAEAVPMEWLVRLSRMAGDSHVEAVYTEWRP